MTPLSIELLLYYYYCPTPHPRKEYSAVKCATQQLFDQGLIELDEAAFRFKTTSKGDAHVIQLCKLPLPENAWVDFTGKVIERE